MERRSAEDLAVAAALLVLLPLVLRVSVLGANSAGDGVRVRFTERR